MKTACIVPLALLVLLLGSAGARAQTPASPDSASGPLEFRAAPPAGTRTFPPDDPDSDPFEFRPRHATEPGARAEPVDEGVWVRPPFGDHLITDPDEFRARRSRDRGEMLCDYNRVDRLRIGAGWEFQSAAPLDPRFGARIEYATGRERILYGAQLEQPLVRPGRLAFGVSMVRRTDHSELQQVEDFENSVALLFSREDFRDYFEREGFGAYLAWRVPDFSTLGIHVRNDRYRSLPLDRGTRSWFHRGRPLRDNPAIDEGEAHTIALRSERLMHRTRAMRAGLYHWVEIERAGGGLGGDFDYARALADVRSVIRLSPATTLMLRGVGGTNLTGTLPAQKRFVVGGVDGLRGHPLGAFTGERLVLAQAEYVLGLWQLTHAPFEGGLQVLAFVDAGTAWDQPESGFDLASQRVACDGGFGLATGDDGLRLYFARDLQDPDSDFVVTLRLQRPF